MKRATEPYRRSAGRVYRISVPTATRILRCLLPAVLLAFFPEGHKNLRAQPPAVAENFFLTDISGVDHELYTYLDEGYSVLLVAGAAWSAASWELHESGVMAALYEAHGPAGLPGVSASTTDDLMVIFAEADTDTDDDALFGFGPFTQGDWTEGTQYPLINLDHTGVLSGYGIFGFPAGRLICPDRLIRPVFTGFDAETVTAANIYSEAADCPAAFGTVNPALVSYTGEKKQRCNDGTAELAVVVQNMGGAVLQNMEVTVSEGGTVLLTESWTGSLQTYAFEEISLGTVAVSGGQNIVIEITSEDEQPSNGWLAPFIEATGVSGTTAEVHFYTDFYPAESAWSITDENGITVASGGPYQSGNADPDGGGGPDANAVMVHEVSFPDTEACYTITVTDSEGDGLVYGGNPAGAFGIEVFNNGNSVVRIELENFGSSFTATDAFRVDPLLSSAARALREAPGLYPNPARNEVHVKQPEGLADHTELRFFDLSGKLVKTEKLSRETLSAVDVSNLPKGMYIVTLSTTSGGSTSAKLVIAD